MNADKSHQSSKEDLLRRTVESLRDELLTVYEELSLLYSLGAKIGRLGDEDQIAAVALREALEITEADCGWVVRWDSEQPRVPEGCRLHVPAATVEQIIGRVLEPLHFRNKGQLLSHALRQEWGIEQPDAPARFLASSLPSGDISLGYLCLGRREGARIFTSADQKLINAVASLTAVELENERLRRSEIEKARLESELDLARGVQRSLAPRDFACNDFLEASGQSVPCYEVVGDYFDLLPLDTGRCLLVMADVSGKGPAAALQAAMLQGVVHAAAQHTADVPALMATINECIRRRAMVGNFITAFVGILERAGRLRYSNGGHNPPLWIAGDGRVTQLTEGGPLMGLLEEPRYQEAVIQLTPGDLLLLYTDGVTEAENPRGETWGVLRILDWAKRQAGGAPAEVEQSLVQTVTQFCTGRRRADDLTVLAVRYGERGTHS
jgi:serine phosphatase RsbU (regulator of sigma subunit)